MIRIAATLALVALALVVSPRSQTSAQTVPPTADAGPRTLGLGTIIMTFAAEYFSHIAAASLGFGAFAILFREREGPPRLVAVEGASR